jgi:hypothetical protein
MNKVQSRILVLLLILTGIIVSFLVNFLIIDSLLIPDICKYHAVEPNWFINLLFTFESADGGHPFPSLIHLIINLILGILLGLFIYKNIKRNKTQKSTTN